MARPRIATLELLCYRGEDYFVDATQYASAAPDAAVVDITGWTIKATVSAQGSDEVELEVDATLTDPDEGDYQLLFPSDDTAAFAAAVHDVDIWRLNNGAKTVLAKGTLTVKEPVRFVEVPS